MAPNPKKAKHWLTKAAEVLNKQHQPFTPPSVLFFITTYSTTSSTRTPPPHTPQLWHRPSIMYETNAITSHTRHANHLQKLGDEEAQEKLDALALAGKTKADRRARARLEGGAEDEGEDESHDEDDGDDWGIVMPPGAGGGAGGGKKKKGKGKKKGKR